MMRDGMRIPQRPHGGFTLVEVMVALVVIGVAIVTLLSTHLFSTRSYAEARVTTISSMLAERKIAELAEGDLPEPGETSGVFEDNENYGWLLTVSETDLDWLREIVLEVSLAAANGAEETPRLGGVRVVTFTVDPGKKEEEEGEKAQ